MDSLKIKEINGDEENSLTTSVPSMTMDTIGSISPLCGPNNISKRKFMITDILNNCSKNPSIHPQSSNINPDQLCSQSPKSVVGSAFQSLSSSTSGINQGTTSSTSTVPHLDVNQHHPAAAAAAMAAMGAAGTDLRLYSNFLPAAALQQIQQHREQFLMSHQRRTSDGNDFEENGIANPNDVDVEEDNQGDSEG